MPRIVDRAQIRELSSGFPGATAEMDAIDAGTMHGYQAQHPSALGYAQNLAANGNYPRPQMRQVDPKVLANAQQTITNHSLDVRDGFAPPPTQTRPIGSVNDTRAAQGMKPLLTPEQRQASRSNAIAQIHARSAPQQQTTAGRLAPGIGVGAAPPPDRQQETIYAQRQAAIQAREESERAAKEAERMRPKSPNELFGVLPIPEADPENPNQKRGPYGFIGDQTPEEYQRWIADAMKRWIMFQQGISGQAPPVQPPPLTDVPTIGGPGALPNQPVAPPATGQYGTPRPAQPYQTPSPDQYKFEPKISTPEEYRALPKGAFYIDPEGTRRQKK